MKITRIEIRDYRGVREIATDIGSSGALIKGRNTEGKTSILRAITAALAARGCEPTDIRKGADSSEILINMDGLRVRRSITQKGTSLTVTNKDGDKWGKPQTRLDELLGSAPIDALDFFLAPKAKRRQMVLDALPISVTAEDVVRWTGDAQLVDALGVDGHGLVVLERFRKHFYEMRTEANSAARKAKQEADEAMVYRPGEAPAPADARTVEAAELLRAQALQSLREIEARERSVARMRDTTAGTRGRVKQLREEAEAKRATGATEHNDDSLRDLRKMLKAALETVRDLEAKLEISRREAGSRQLQVDTAEQSIRDAEKAALDAKAIEAQADELEKTVDATTADAPTEEEKQAAADALSRAMDGVATAQANVTKNEAWEKAEAAREQRARTAASAERLDKMVKLLTETAPGELIARAGAIPGLGVDGDKVTLDGVEVDSLSGMEQMKFAVALARRINHKSKILVVDGLERLDAVQGIEFAKMATADGFQLLATRVDNGELVVEAIEP